MTDIASHCSSTSRDVPPQPHIDGVLSAMRRMRDAGLKDIGHALVLTYLVKAAAEIDSDVIQLSSYEVGREVGLDHRATQRAFDRLAELGMLVRAQAVQRKGCVGRKTLTSAAYACFGLIRGLTLPDGLPASLRAALARLDAEAAQLVADAWSEGRALPDELTSPHRLPAALRGEIESTLAQRSAALEAEVVKAVDAAHRRELEHKRGIWRVALAGGSDFVLDQQAYMSVAQTPADVRFAHDVLAELVKQVPEAVTEDTAPRLAAEILYSRQIGFARDLQASRAVGSIVSLVRQGRWGRPRSIRSTWYSALEHSSRVERCPQPARLAVA